MAVIVFLIDTSASMYQKCHVSGGAVSILDVAKMAVENFVKIRLRNPDNRQDRYMLLSFDEYPDNVKSGWKESLPIFMKELKNLQGVNLTTIGQALKQVFYVLNLNRMQNSIDTYGYGRCPFFLEPVFILLISDGGKFTSLHGVIEDLNIPMQAQCGFELTREPFRWDQRLFALVLRLPGTPVPDDRFDYVARDDSHLDAMCEATGGRSYRITSYRMLMQSIESLVNKVQNGVVVDFEKIDSDVGDKNCSGSNLPASKNACCLEKSSQMSFKVCRNMIYVPHNSQKKFMVGYWPIPESFWPEINMSTLPPRSAHPKLKISCEDNPATMPEAFPFDKYELEPSPLTQHILSKRKTNIRWPVYMPIVNRSEKCPFGYLSVNAHCSSVSLVVLPFNYTALVPIVADFFRHSKQTINKEWIAQLQNYLKSIPPYYIEPMRRVFIKMGVSKANAWSIIPENVHLQLHPVIKSRLQKFEEQAKTEFEKLCYDILQKHVDKNKKTPTNYTDPFFVSRSKLLDEIKLKRFSFTRRMSCKMRSELETKHCLPVNEMGNYQEYLKRSSPPLRELFSAPVRKQIFGNPFTVDKSAMVDEADVGFRESLSSLADQYNQNSSMEKKLPKRKCEYESYKSRQKKTKTSHANKA